jgi:hypothetical protein
MKSATSHAMRFNVFMVARRCDRFLVLKVQKILDENKSIYRVCAQEGRYACAHKRWSCQYELTAHSRGLAADIEENNEPLGLFHHQTREQHREQREPPSRIPGVNNPTGVRVSCGEGPLSAEVPLLLASSCPSRGRGDGDAMAHARSH